MTLSYILSFNYIFILCSILLSLVLLEKSISLNRSTSVFEYL
jgi:hypothetical protein